MKPPDFPASTEQSELRSYVDRTWDSLTRGTGRIFAAIDDPKLPPDAGEILYVPSSENLEAVTAKIMANIPAGRRPRLEVRNLPAERDSIREHGLLYLPGDYVVPGGRFNEFYGWDSYFISRGLLISGRLELARSMAEQALYEVQHYGSVLNANRTYYLTRSHPPVLSMMVADIFRATGDRGWLSAALPLVEKYYYYWRVPPHLNQATGLSRYRDLGNGPAPEVLASERDESGRSHYDRVKGFLKEHPIDDYDVDLYYDRERDELTDLAYIGDRSMRESGFDPTDRFGKLNLDVVHYAPVCLNTLLLKMEEELAVFHHELGNPDAARFWEERVMESKERINRYFWNERRGLYFDYHLGRESQREYPFLTTFWPLWAGVASQEQAERVVGNLDLFLQPGGLEASPAVTGEQWDAPFAWAPLQLLAVDGLERYGFHEEAREIARRFVAMVATSFKKEGVLREKYDARSCTSNIEGKIGFGYVTNEPGFGWTNAVVAEFLGRFGDG
ncbi:alpha,alpha-trehalase [Luteolibacter sp. GHJ8]|uniref:Alpha,alpha-trehalase n=1 Tax=Luteolibacter rhizosphaerae TaxID=2989719 RepID=A0ABT3FZE8_9BACT|nr:alpha,alpha-trehalase [Luteolibacter rhizosphaerae]MCW1912966.1 alpha,alpha-trehalase [Luteolibacter rhizosphaerae]